MTATRRLTLVALVALWALAGALLLGGSAQGADTHEYLSRISEVPATGPHGEPVPNAGPFEAAAHSMTIDGGSLYVANNGQLDIFNTTTNDFSFQFPQLPQPYGFANQSVAIGHSTGETEIYDIGDEGSGQEAVGVVAVYNSAGEVQGYWKGVDTPAKTFECFECQGGFGGVAVDNSPNPFSHGNVYVSAPEEHVIDVFEPKPGGGEQYVTQLTESEPGVSFEGLFGVSVDQQNGNLFVLDGHSLDVFEPTALEHYTLVRRITGTPTQGQFAGGLHGVAVNNNTGDIFVLVVQGENEVVDQFNSEGIYLGQLTGTTLGPFGKELGAVAVDPESGDVYVSERRQEKDGSLHGYVDIFGPNIVLPDVTTTTVSDVTHAGATLSGTVNPDGAGEASCRFVWGTGPDFGNEAPCEPESVAEGNSPTAVHATLRGLLPDTTYYYRLEATNKADGHTNPGEPAQDQQFTTAGPGIEVESTSDVAATSATLDASIDPNGAPTSYYFQYGTSAAYGSEVPAAPGLVIGSAKGSSEVSQHLQGLLPNTVYHYRAVAVSELRPGEFVAFEGADETFVTQRPGYAFAPPDGRQWEMVSPPEKRGAEINPIGGEFGVEEASVNGNAFTYTSNVPNEADPQGYTEQAQTLAARDAEGWMQRDIDPSHSVETGPSVGEGPQYKAFSEDLSQSVVHPFAGFEPLLSAEASEPTAYLRSDYLNGNVEDPCLPATMSCYRPLVTDKAGYSNVTPGTVFGEEEPGESRECIYSKVLCGPEVVAVTPDLKHLALISKVPLMPGGGRLYEWAAGKLTSLEDEYADAYENRPISPRHGISTDGGRVVVAVQGDPSMLVMRDITTGQSVQLDAVQGGSGENPAEPEFQIASSDDSKVFFTDTQQLTANSHQAPSEENLYECEVVEVAGQLKCELSDLTPSEPGEAKVLGAVLGASEDGSYVYFVADGKLAEGAVSGTCVPGSASPDGSLCNLYLYHDGVTKLVAILSGRDYDAWEPPASQIARVSPDGQWLAFMSQQDLTGYVTRDARDGRPDAEVYLYHASNGSLVCASCDPTGARPIGISTERGLLAENRLGFEQVAASVPRWEPYQGTHEAYYQPRYLSDGGRVFFDSDDALVPQDVNGTEDVYEYEPPGAGSCTVASSTYSERASGCIDMISSGTSAEESVFLDASGDGGDVFFLTAAKLAPQDFDTALDIYDAHECTNAAPCYREPPVVPPPCDTGDACKPSPTPQPAIFGSPSSATFSGAGNISPSSTTSPLVPKATTRSRRLAQALKVCRTRRGRRRSVCERQARARYAVRAGKANNAKRKGGRG